MSLGTANAGLWPLLLLFAWTACAPVDTGNPPLDPSDATTDLGRVEGMFLAGGGTTYTGFAGAVTPPAGSVHITNLDDESDIWTGPVAADGSFSVFVEDAVGEVLRLQIVDGAARSRPVDSGDGFETALVAEPTCLRMPTWIGFELSEGEAADVSFEVTNLCATAVEWGAWEPRTESGLITAWPAPERLAPGETRSFDLSIVNRGQDEEVLLLSVLAPVESRRALTVSVTAP